MNRKNLIRNLTITAGIIAVVSLLGLLSQEYVNRYRQQVLEEKYSEYITAFMAQNKAYLQGIAVRIKSLPVDPVIINELQSQYDIEEQNAGQSKRYIWMSDSNGEFLFGFPSNDFEILNSFFDNNQRVPRIRSYTDRNDYLNDFVDNDRISNIAGLGGSRTIVGGPRQLPNAGISVNVGPPPMRSTSASFSTSVYDDNGEVIGKLFMKVDDSANADKYTFTNNYTPHIIWGILLALSFIFLCFLLPTWVYVDARERGVKVPAIWAFLTLISLIFGLTIYLLTRPANYRSNNCPRCAGELNGTEAYCPYCGHDLSNVLCRQCQYPIRPEWRFCPNCKAETRAKKEVAQVSDAL